MRFVFAFAFLLAGCAQQPPAATGAIIGNSSTGTTRTAPIGAPGQISTEPGFSAFCQANPHKGTCP